MLIVLPGMLNCLSGSVPLPCMMNDAPNKQGPIHPGQYHPWSVKEEKKVEASCTAFTGAKFSGISLKIW